MNYKKEKEYDEHGKMILHALVDAKAVSQELNQQ